MPLENLLYKVDGSNSSISKTEIKIEGDYPVYTQSANVLPDGYSDRKEIAIKDIPVILYGDHTNVIKWIDKPFVIGADGVKLVKTKEDAIDNRYLYHAILSKIHEIPNGYARHFSKLRKLLIPIPSKESQKRIVQILDNFDAVCNDLTVGLPAEIEARHMQYEYYRDKLLSF